MKHFIKYIKQPTDTYKKIIQDERTKIEQEKLFKKYMLREFGYFERNKFKDVFNKYFKNSSTKYKQK